MNKFKLNRVIQHRFSVLCLAALLLDLAAPSLISLTSWQSKYNHIRFEDDTGGYVMTIRSLVVCSDKGGIR